MWCRSARQDGDRKGNRPAMVRGNRNSQFPQITFWEAPIQFCSSLGKGFLVLFYMLLKPETTFLALSGLNLSMGTSFTWLGNEEQAASNS